MEREDFTGKKMLRCPKWLLLVILEAPIETKRFSLVTLDETFVGEEYLEWLSDEETTAYLESRFAPLSGLQGLRSYISSIQESTDSVLLAIVTKKTKVHIGNIKLGPINPHHKTASIGLLIGAKAWWGKGVATETIAATTSWAFDKLHLAKVSAGAYASNVASIRAFELCGFSREGLLHSQVLLESGIRDDIVLLGKVNSDA
jgi:ribosomal-protein-alanine N-acetyltransferase